MKYKAIYKWSSDEDKAQLPEDTFNEYDDNGVMAKFDDDGVFIEVVGYDGGEPEDNAFYRDYKWVETELNKLADRIKILHQLNIRN